MQTQLERIESLYRTAYDLADKDRFAEAKEVLEECLSLGSHPAVDVPARQELARALRELGDLRGALELRRNIKRMAPDRHANLWKLADLLAEMGHLDEALAEAQAALQCQPENQRYLKTFARIRRLLRTSGAEADGAVLAFRTHTVCALGFEVGIPEDWVIASGLFHHLANLLQRNAITAAAPHYDGFARMGIQVRKTDAITTARQRNEYAGETRLAVAGVSGIQAQYAIGGTRFRKISIVKGSREYLIQFGHDGTFDPIIDRIIRSFKFV